MDTDSESQKSDELDALGTIERAIEQIDPRDLGVGEAQRQLEIQQRAAVRLVHDSPPGSQLAGLIDCGGEDDELPAWERLCRWLETVYPDLPRVDQISDARIPLIGADRALHVAPPGRLEAWRQHALAVVGALRRYLRRSPGQRLFDAMGVLKSVCQSTWSDDREGMRDAFVRLYQDGRVIDKGGESSRLREVEPKTPSECEIAAYILSTEPESIRASLRRRTRHGRTAASEVRAMIAVGAGAALDATIGPESRQRTTEIASAAFQADAALTILCNLIDDGSPGLEFFEKQLAPLGEVFGRARTDMAAIAERGDIETTLSVAKSQSTGSQRREPKADWQTKALMAMAAHPDWTQKQIAKAAGVHRGTLSRNPKVAKALFQHQKNKKARRVGSIRHGSKVDGRIEAIDDE